MFLNIDVSISPFHCVLTGLLIIESNIASLSELVENMISNLSFSISGSVLAGEKIYHCCTPGPLNASTTLTQHAKKTPVVSFLVDLSQ